MCVLNKMLSKWKNAQLAETQKQKDADNIEQIKQYPNRRLYNEDMSDQDCFREATKYKTYQINGLDVDF